ncbi:MAG: hypothetical protein QOE90_847 [Thermoplasmata archaeon]|jgi:hypothetical protein|nr:hypothetical protein [Thermoplasmata archaeon]
MHASISSLLRVVALQDDHVAIAEAPVPHAAPDDPRPFAERLADHLYRRAYCTAFQTIPGAPTARDPLANERLFLRLKAEFDQSASWQPGFPLPGRGGHAFLVNGEVLRPAPDEIRREGDAVLVRRRALTAGVSPGWFFLFGSDGGPRPGEGVVRVYLNASAQGVTDVVRATWGALRNAGAEFTMKCLSDPVAYTRADAVVVYVPRSSWKPAREAILAASRDVRRHLRPWQPLFTFPLAHGTGLALSPRSHESFGIVTCRALAAGIDRARATGEDLPAALAASFAAANLSIEAPYLCDSQGPDPFQEGAP